MMLVTATIKGPSFKLTHTYLALEHAKLHDLCTEIRAHVLDAYSFSVPPEQVKVVQLIVRDVDEVAPQERAGLRVLGERQAVNT